ncbi:MULTISPECIES: hypothetical protein [unclassified Caballeronia]|uniref:hypothetical protein n=1 Tax=unclassified Caballeronia TaxID=2646786 RepID=UPI0020291A2E|nr:MULTISPECIES: hypothetical protein [unclassified Caballeronia]
MHTTYFDANGGDRHLVVHRITPTTTMPKSSHHAHGHSRRVALIDPADARALGQVRTDAGASRNLCAELTQQEKAARRAEYLQERHRKAGVDHSRGRSNAGVPRPNRPTVLND